MFVLTLNKKRLGKIAALTLAIALVGGIGVGVKNYFFKNTAAAAASPKQSLQMSTTQEMADYIAQKGYTADLQSAKVKEVKIPKKFDAEFENFNEKIKKTDNLSLEKYKKDKVNKWTFSITDYDVEGKGAVAVLLVKKDKLIGAYLLEMPEGTACPLSKSIQGTKDDIL
ncbi:MAG: DUF4830 domain-containing protein [Oscillospiraceae bacterium]